MAKHKSKNAPARKWLRRKRVLKRLPEDHPDRNVLLLRTSMSYETVRAIRTKKDRSAGARFGRGA